jgi:hypothetical protein
MSLSGAYQLAVTTLSDGRLQVFATVIDNHTHFASLLSTWKTTTDSYAGWVPWNLFTPVIDDPLLSATAMYPTGQSQLWVTTDPLKYLWTLKSSIDPNASWEEWMLLSPFQAEILAASVLGGPLAGYFSNTPTQLWGIFFAEEDIFELRTTSNNPTYSADQPESFYLPWSRFEPQPPQDVYMIWPLSCNGSGTVEYFPLWALGDDNTLYWIVATLSYDESGNYNSLTWSTWSEFPPPPGPVCSFVAGQLPDGRMQLFASDMNGLLWTLWQEPGAGFSLSWQNAYWQPFPLPNGELLYSGVSTPNFSIAMAALADQRLQLFAIDGTSSHNVWTTWKTTTDPDAEWVLPWNQF